MGQNLVPGMQKVTAAPTKRKHNVICAWQEINKFGQIIVFSGLLTQISQSRALRIWINITVTFLFLGIGAMMPVLSNVPLFPEGPSSTRSDFACRCPRSSIGRHFFVPLIGNSDIAYTESSSWIFPRSRRPMSRCRMRHTSRRCLRSNRQHDCPGRSTQKSGTLSEQEALMRGRERGQCRPAFDRQVQVVGRIDVRLAVASVRPVANHRHDERKLRCAGQGQPVRVHVFGLLTNDAHARVLRSGE